MICLDIICLQHFYLWCGVAVVVVLHLLTCEVWFVVVCGSMGTYCEPANRIPALTLLACKRVSEVRYCIKS